MSKSWEPPYGLRSELNTMRPRIDGAAGAAVVLVVLGTGALVVVVDGRGALVVDVVAGRATVVVVVGMATGAVVVDGARPGPGAG
jgi:hypothetical protein